MAGSFISSRTGAPLKVPAKFALSSSSQDSCGRLSTCARDATISLISRLFVANLDLVARAQDDARDVDALAVHQDVPVADDLPRLRAREREAEAVHDVVEPRLEQAEHLLARTALPARRVEVVLLELALQHAVDAADLLLLAKADRVLAQLDARLAVLPRGIRPAGVRALLGVAALALEEELHALAAAQLANGTVITSHLLSSLSSRFFEDRFTRARRFFPDRHAKAPGHLSIANQTRRRLGGRQPLWGTGVTSRMSVTLKPTACRARSALSRPAPGPFTKTATERIPCSIALRAASSAASCAANGVLLREPLKPREPALDQATVLPFTSVIVTTVLLKVDWMCAIPVATFFFAFFLAAFGFGPPPARAGGSGGDVRLAPAT